MKLHRLALAAGALILSCVSAQAACTLSHPAPASPWSSTTRLDTMTSDAVNITGGCIDGVKIGENAPVTISGLLGESVIGRGADNTGANDVSAVVQAMVTTGRNNILFPAGTYKFSNNVILSSGKLTIRCEPGKTTLIAAANHTADAALFWWAKTGTTLESYGCKYDGNMSNVGVDEPMIIGTGTVDDRFEFNTFTNNRKAILSEAGSTRPKFNFNHLTNVGWWFANGGPTDTINIAVTFNGGTTAPEIIGNDVDTIGGDFVDLSSNDFVFVGNRVIGGNNGFISTVSGAGQGAIYPELGVTGGVISGNYVYGLTGHGFDIHCAHHITVTGNTSKHNGLSGIAVSGSPAGDTTTCNAGGTADSISHVTISGNTTLNNGQSLAGNATLSTNALTASGSAVLSFAATTGVVDGTLVTATGVPVNTFVQSHTGTTVTLTRNTTGVANGASVTFGYPAHVNSNNGITIGCGNTPSSCAADNLSITGNVASDDQSTATQRYGIGYNEDATVTVTNSKISCSNVVSGNTVAPTAMAFSDCESIPVSTQTASNSASLAWTGLTGSNYRLVCSILPATNAVAAQVILGEGGTPTYKTTAYYWGGVRVPSSTGTVTGAAGNNAAYMGGFDGGNQINTAGYNQSFSLMLHDLSSSSVYKGMYGFGSFVSGAGVGAQITTGGSYQGDTNPITAVKVQYSSGNIASGSCSLYALN